MKRFLVLTVLVFVFVVSMAQDFPSWLAGKWEIPSQSAMSGSSYEDWTSVSDNYLIGRTYRIFGNETMYFDNMEILQEGSMVVLKMSAGTEGYIRNSTLNFDPYHYNLGYSLLGSHIDAQLRVVPRLFLNISARAEHTTYDHRKQMDTILHALRIVAARKDKTTI